jgi:hypothetical protein
MRRSWILVALGWIVSVSTVTARAQDGQIPIPKPTKEHRVFRSEVGVWDAIVKTFMSPDGKATESKGTEVNRLLPGGLWLVSDFKGEFAGQPFQGRGQYGYDTAKKKYVGTWVDTMSTSLLIMEGTYDEAMKMLTLLGDMVDEKGKTLKTKSVSTTKNDGSREFTIYMKSDQFGPDFVKMMEISYKKQPRKEPAKPKAQ